MELRQSDSTSVRPESSRLDPLFGFGLAAFLVLLPFHLVLKQLLPEPAGTYWKEILLGLLVLVWLVRSVQMRAIQRTGTTLDWAVLAYLGLLVVRALFDRAGLTTAWGLYISVLYLPLFWLIPALLRRSPGWLTGIAWLLTGVGAVVALGGLLEFALDRTLWPSAEIIERQGFPDVYVYGTQLRRVYFVFDSPTTLANTLAMLLPMALSLAIAPAALWKRIAAGAAAVLMAACVVVTFSRGIWVAAAIALVFMAVQSSFVQRNRKPLAAAFGVLAVALVAFVLLLAPRTARQGGVDEGRIRELPGQEFQAVTGQVVADLAGVPPADGEVVLQNWALTDPIARKLEERQVIYQHPTEMGKGEITFNLPVPENGALRFGIALSPEVWSPEKGDGAAFELFISTPQTSGAGEMVFNRYINPKINPSDRRWRNYLVNLAPWAGQTVTLHLVTQSGPAGDWAYDWAGWAGIQVVQVDPALFAQADGSGQNLLFDHLGSITDWTRDETNRDRLAAWNLSLGAWRQNPLFGTGLGSTGVAALRANPESAFVTESQVLKALAELGILGLLSLAYLWFEIARNGWRVSRRALTAPQRAVWLGLAAGLLVVFIESLVYQNLEVKQVNAYFWTFTGMLAYLSAVTQPREATGEPPVEMAEDEPPAGAVESGETENVEEKVA